MSYSVDDIYLKVLSNVKVYHLEPVGFTNFEGEKTVDKNYPKQFNVVIGLLIEQNRLLERELGDIKERLLVLEDKKQKATEISLPQESVNQLAEELKRVAISKKTLEKYPPEKTRVISWSQKESKS